MPVRFDCDDEPNKYMAMPCRCDCGKWFDLHDGWSSVSNRLKIVCRECYELDNIDENEETE